MPSREDHIKELIARATQAAFDRGYQAAMAEFQQTLFQAAHSVKKGAVATSEIARPRGKRSGKASAVLEFIRDHPGLAGADVARGLPKIPERTTRTILRRLRILGKLIQKDGGWVVND